MQSTAKVKGTTQRSKSKENLVDPRSAAKLTPCHTVRSRDTSIEDVFRDKSGRHRSTFKSGNNLTKERSRSGQRGIRTVNASCTESNGGRMVAFNMDTEEAYVGGTKCKFKMN